MFRKQLLRHVVNRLREGVSERDIARELIADGWPRSDVDAAFEYALYPERLKHFSLSRMFTAQIPAWVEALSVVLIAGAFLGTGVYFGHFKAAVYSYELALPEKPDITNNILHYGSQPALANRNFFEEVQGQLVSDKVNFVVADLSSMKLVLYKEGNVVLEVPILAKGKEGSWWETPSGLYRIETKEDMHFSTFGNVYQPWSMAFQGNFFIHGWPQYSDGSPVASSYSGGCIRLSTEDAGRVFSEVEVGMPVLVFEKDLMGDGKKFEIKKPSVTAPYYLAADMKGDFVFMEKRSSEEVPIASLAKLMTALTAAEHVNLDKRAFVDQSMIVPTAKPRLSAGTSVIAYQLLFPLLLESSNEAAEALAEAGPGRADFIQKMNIKAQSLGMKDTYFVDPSGVEGGNTSTLQDMFLMTKYIYHNRSFILRFSSESLDNAAYSPSQWSGLENHNSIRGLPGFVGGKTDESATAGGVGVGIFEVSLGGETRPIMIAVVGSSDERADIETILDYIKAGFE